MLSYKKDDVLGKVQTFLEQTAFITCACLKDQDIFNIIIEFYKILYRLIVKSINVIIN